MKKHRSLRLISLLLSFIICLSSFPISAFSSELTGDAVGALEEDVSRRDKYTKHFIDSDGSRYAVVYSEQVHYQKNNEWLDIDNSLTLDSAGEKYESNNEIFKTAFAKNSNDSQLVSIEEDGYKLSWSISFASDTSSEVMPAAANASAVRIEQKQGQLAEPDGEDTGFKTKENMTHMGKTMSGIRYNGVFNDRVDIRYSVLHGKVEEDVILNSPGAFTSYTLTLNTNGLTAIKQSDNSVEFVNSDNEAIFTLGAPWMKDTAAAVSHEIDVSVIQKGNIAYITYTPDSEWLNDTERLYPVLIDPSFTTRTYTSNIEDTYVYQGSSSTTASENTIKIGTYSGEDYYGYVKILNIPTIFYSWEIQSAVLKLFTTSASEPAIDIYSVTEDWDVDTLDYDESPESVLIAESLDAQAATVGYCYGYDIIGATDEDENSIFENYLSYGFMITCSETDENTQIYSSEHDMVPYRPVLVFEYSYDPVPGLEDGGVYSFKNKASNQYLSVQDGANVNGTNVCLSSEDSPGSAQAFRLAYESGMNCFRIGAICSSDGYGKVLNFSLSSTADSSQFANLRIYNYDEDDSAWEDDQAWMIVPDSTGNYFSILSKADPNLAITAYGSAGEDAPGTTATSEGNVFVTEFTGANNQLWTIESGDRAVSCGNSIKSGGIYDKPEGSTSLSFACAVSNFGDTVTWSSNNTNRATVDQSGNITCIKAGKSIITATVTHTDGTATQYTATVYVIIENGVYYMLNEETGYRLEYQDTTDYSEGAVMEIYDYSEDAETEPETYALFKIKHLGEGKYSIRSMLRNDMGWTFSSDSELVMTNIGTSDSGITDATKWCIGYDSNGYYIYNIFHADTVTAPADSGESIYSDSYLEDDLLQHWELTRVTTSMNDVVIYDKVSTLLAEKSAAFSAAVYSSSPSQNGQNGIIWSVSDDTGSATIDADTGVLTGKIPGTVIVTATYYANSYTTWADTYTVHIYRPAVVLIHGRSDNSFNVWGAENSVAVDKDNPKNKDNNHYDSSITAVTDGNNLLYTAIDTQSIISVFNGKYTGDDDYYVSKHPEGGNLANYLVNAGYTENVDLFVFNYPNQDAVVYNALKLQAYLENLANDIRLNGTTQEKLAFFGKTTGITASTPYCIDIVGHSMGGLVARYYIENRGKDENVRKLITVDTPHWGSDLATTSSNTGILHMLCDHDLRPDSAMYGGNYDTTLILCSFCGGTSYTLTDELNYDIERSTKYYAIAGIDLPLSSLDKNDKGIDLEPNYTSLSEISNKIKNEHSTFDYIDIYTESDNTVDFLSQIGCLGSQIDGIEKKIEFEKIFVNIDTNGGNDISDHFHGKMPHRKIVIDKIIAYLNEATD